MDMLHLVPVAVLCSVCCWLIWPVVVEPMLRRLNGGPSASLGSADLLADDLFEAWTERS